MYKNLGKLDRAFECIDRAIAIGSISKCGALCEWHQTKGILAFWKGDFPVSIICSKEALKKASISQRERATLNSHLSLGRTYLFLEDFKAARRHLKKGLAMALEVKFPREEALAYEFLGDLDRVDGDGDVAGDLYRKGMEIGLRIAPRGDVVCEIGRRLADWRIDKGDLKQARIDLEHALEIAEESGDRREEGILCRVKAKLIRASGGRYQSSETAIRKSIRILEEVGARYEVALSYMERARQRSNAPRRSKEDRRNSLADYVHASSILGDLKLSKKRGLLLVEAVSVMHEVVAPHEGLGLLREAEELLRPHRTRELIDQIERLRARLEKETARVAMKEKSTLHMEGARGNDLDSIIRGLSQRLGAKIAFLHLPNAPEGARAVGSDLDEAGAIVSRLPFSGTGDMLVSAGTLLKEGSECHGPFLAYRPDEEDPPTLYLERRIGAPPFHEREASEFATFAEHLVRKIPRARAPRGQRQYPTIIAGSKAMQATVDRVVSVRNSTATVLIEGETGTGKGLLARLLHEMSDRSRTGRLVHVHCAELPETLLESELFGHARGAFTGAVSEKEGLFEFARAGTLFLDEVGDLTSAVQMRLLRVIEEGKLKRVGEAADREIDVRIVAATHRNLEEAVDNGFFRRDLFYRLHVIRVHVPPLRERHGDVPLLAKHFIDRYAVEENKKVSGIESEAMRLLARYSWPGNVRELQNEIRRIIALLPSGDSIGESEISPAIASGGRGKHRRRESVLLREVATFEENRVREVVRETGGNARATATILGISPQLLRYKLKKYGIDLPKV